MMIYRLVDSWRDKQVYYSQEKLSLWVVNTENYCQLLTHWLYESSYGRESDREKRLPGNQLSSEYTITRITICRNIEFPRYYDEDKRQTKVRCTREALLWKSQYYILVSMISFLAHIVYEIVGETFFTSSLKLIHN